MGQEPAANQPRHVVNQLIGLLVFAGGVVLLVLVFSWAYHIYLGLDANPFHVAPLPGQPHVAGVPAAAPLPPGTITAAPQPASGILSAAAVLILKLLTLLGMGWIGALVASKGISLAVGPATPARPRE